MDAILVTIISCLVGAVFFTIISYVVKYLQETQTQFNMLFLYTSLVSMVLTTLLSPVFLLPGILPFAVSGATGYAFLIVAGFCMGVTANWLINMPVSYLLKQLSTAKVTSLSAVSNSKKYLVYAVAFIGLIALLGGTSVFAIAQYNASVHTTGTIKGIGVKVFNSSALTVELTSLDWGIREPGSSVGVDIWVKNTGNSPVTLAIYTSDWVPATAQDYMTLTWDYADQTLPVDGFIRARLTLEVSQSISGITNFAFQINIIATG